jgi:hypothetical protein
MLVILLMGDVLVNVGDITHTSIKPLSKTCMLPVL